MRIAVLASGSGTLLEAILDDGIPVALVVVDRPSQGPGGGRGARRRRRSWSSAPSFGADFDRDAYTSEVVDVLAGRTTSSSW